MTQRAAPLHALHRAVRLHRQRDVLLRREPADVERHEIVAPPRPTPPGARPSAAPDRTARRPRRGRARARRRSRSASNRRRSSALATRVPRVRLCNRRRYPLDHGRQPAQPIVARVVGEVRVKAAEHGHAQSVRGPHGGPSERPLGRHVHRVRAPLAPAVPQCPGRGQTEAHLLVRGQPEAADQRQLRIPAGSTATRPSPGWRGRTTETA